MKRSSTLSRVLLALSLGLVALAAACNTVEGVGKDIEAGGEAIQRAAD